MSASSLAEAIPVAEARAVVWSLATRVAFRFTFIILLLHLPMFVWPLADPWLAATDPIVKAAAQSLFDVKADVLPNGSGDTTWNWVQLFLIAATSAAAMLIWSVVQRRATSHPRLYRWFRVYVRFALAWTMVFYGAIKVFPAQFPPPTLERLIMPFGDASPMGLLWSFMGASFAYNVFTGIGEVLAGLLLTTRRTTLAGALLSAAIMTHVAALNYMYDVPVKIFSSLLVFMALVLIAPDARRLAAFFFAPAPHAAWWKIVFRTVLVLAFVGYAFADAAKARKERGDIAAKSPLYGIWNVEEMTVDGVPRAPLLSETARWRRFVFDNRRFLSIQLVSDHRDRYTIDLKESTFTLGKRDDPAYKASFMYSRPDAGTLIVDGAMEGKKMHATLRRAEDREFVLNTRGFHWINEYPFHR